MTTLADTNVLLAFLLEDRSVEREAVAAWVEAHGPLVIGEAVLVETCWVLGGGANSSREEGARRVRELLASSSFEVWDDDLVSDALELMERHPQLAIVDCLLAARAARGDAVLTFDRRLSRVIDAP